MDKRKNKIFFSASFEDASILRKFTILFLIASIVPMGLLFLLYSQQRHTGHITLPEGSFTAAMIFMALGVLAGYSAMRSLLKTFIDITEKNRKTLEKILTPQAVAQLGRGENEIAVLSRSFSVVTQQLEDNIKSLEDAKKMLHSVMTKVGQGISSMEKLDTFLELILETTTSALNGKVSTLLLLNENKTELHIKSVWGARFNPAQAQTIKLFQGSPFLKVIEEKKPQVASGVFLQSPDNIPSAAFFGESVLCVPLLYHDKVLGLMTICKIDEAQNGFSKEDINLVFHLASQTAVALENSRLNSDIEKTYFETISALALAVDAKDKYSRGHLDRVAEYVKLMGEHLGLDDEDLNNLIDAARLHDLGKIGVPDEILRKDTGLTDEEWVIMRRHPDIGESIIKPVRSLLPLCDIIRHHHEKLDGSGYPDGLKGEEISPLVRILTVADVYDALTTERSYRPKKSRLDAAHILRSMKNELDQDVVEVLLESLETHNK